MASTQEERDRLKTSIAFDTVVDTINDWLKANRYHHRYSENQKIMWKLEEMNNKLCESGAIEEADND